MRFVLLAGCVLAYIELDPLSRMLGFISGLLRAECGAKTGLYDIDQVTIKSHWLARSHMAHCRTCCTAFRSSSGR